MVWFPIAWVASKWLVDPAVQRRCARRQDGLQGLFDPVIIVLPIGKNPRHLPSNTRTKK
jgi:hypothetical protein